MKNVEKAREVRLWITRVIFPIGVYFMVSPKARNFVSAEANKVKNYISSKLPKKD